MRYRTLFIAIPIAFALLASGCGGDEGPTADPYEGHIFIGDMADTSACTNPRGTCGATYSNIQISPQNLIYEQQDGQVKGTLGIVNSGKGNLRIDSIEVEGDAESLQLRPASTWTERVMQELTVPSPRPVFIGPDGSLRLEFWWDGRADLSETALILRTNDPDSVEVRVPFTAIVMPEPEPVVEPPCHEVLAVATLRGHDDPPSNDIMTRPLETLEFAVTSETLDLEDIERYEWTILAKPENSTVRLTPSNQVSNPNMFIDLNGGYTIEVSLLLKEGSGEVCADPRVEVYVAPCDC